MNKETNTRLSELRQQIIKATLERQELVNEYNKIYMTKMLKRICEGCNNPKNTFKILCYDCFVKNG